MKVQEIGRRAVGAMTRTSHMAAAALVLTGILVIGSAPSAAAPARYNTPEECIQAKPTHVDVMDWSCTSVDGGGWTSSTNQRTPGGLGGIGLVLVGVLLWSLIPLMIAAGLANARKESLGAAVGLTLVLGWVGLAIVYFGQARSRDTVEGLADRLNPKSVATADAGHGVPTVDQPTGGIDAEERLRRLDRLHREGLVSDEEFQQQRRHIVDSL